MHRNINRIQKLLASILLIFISFGNYFAFIHQTSGYETSIYISTPIEVWLSLSISLIAGTLIIIQQVHSRQYKRSNFWMTALLIVILSKLSILFIPYTRGYYFLARGDTLSHVGMAKDILNLGTLESNYYPILHLIYSIQSYLVGADIEVIVRYTVPVLSIFFMLYIYLLAKSVFCKQEYQLLSLAASGVILNIYFFATSPNGASILYLPLVLYLIFTKTLPHRILLVIVLTIIPIFHPLTGVILILMMLFIWGIFKLLARLKCPVITSKGNSTYLLSCIVILIVICTLWILSFRSFYNNIRTLVRSVLVGSDQVYLYEIAQKLDKVDIHGIDFVTLIIKVYGVDIIFGLLLIASIIIVLRSRTNNGKFIAILGLDALLLILWGLYLVGIMPGLESIAGHRLLIFTLIFNPLIAGFILAYTIEQKKVILISLVVFLICAASVLSILNLWISPYTQHPNEQVTNSDISGMEWLLLHKNPQIGTVSIASDLVQFSHAIIGIKEVQLRQDITRDYIPDHFNYTNSTSLAGTYGKTYVVLPVFDKELYTGLYANIGRFNLEDFELLNADLSAHEVYNNKEFEVYFVG